MPRVGLTREKVIEKAAELANERGIEAVTITTLSQHLGIKKPSLYNHIKGPEDIYQGIMIYGWRHISECAAYVQNENPCAALREYAEIVYRYALGNPGVFEAMLWYNRYQSEELKLATTELYRFFFAQTDKLHMDRETANHILRTYRAMIEGFLLLVIHDAFGNPVSIEESYELTLDVFMKGIEQYEK